MKKLCSKFIHFKAFLSSLCLLGRFNLIVIAYDSPFPILSREFCKRMDKDLPFHYWTLNERFQTLDSLPSFSEEVEVGENVDAREHPLRLHRLVLNTREDPSIFVAGRSFLPARNQTTIR